MSIRFEIQNCMLSHCHVKTPRAVNQGDEPRYSCELIIDPQQAGVDWNQWSAAIAHVAQEKWPNGPPPNAKYPQIVPAEQLIGSGKTDYSAPHYRGKWILRTANKNPPLCVDFHRNPIDASNIYSGCYANVAVNIYSYVGQMAKGVTVGLEGIMKIGDGQRLDGRPTYDQLWGSPTGAPVAGNTPPQAAGPGPGAAGVPGGPPPGGGGTLPGNVAPPGHAATAPAGGFTPPQTQPQGAPAGFVPPQTQPQTAPQGFVAPQAHPQPDPQQAAGGGFVAPQMQPEQPPPQGAPAGFVPPGTAAPTTPVYGTPPPAGVPASGAPVPQGGYQGHPAPSGVPGAPVTPASPQAPQTWAPQPGGVPPFQK